MSGLEGYVDVSARLHAFSKEFPGGRVFTEDWGVESLPNGDSFVWVKAMASRFAGDPLPGVGMAWEQTPGTTEFTYGSELQNAEASAWGRAIRSVIIEQSGPIASKDEVQLRQAPLAKQRAAEVLKLCVAAGEDKSRLALVAIGVVASKDQKVGAIVNNLTPLQADRLVSCLETSNTNELVA